MDKNAKRHLMIGDIEGSFDYTPIEAYKHILLAHMHKTMEAYFCLGQTRLFGGEYEAVGFTDRDDAVKYYLQLEKPVKFYDIDDLDDYEPVELLQLIFCYKGEWQHV